jgi:hypothetical protein
MEPGSVSFTAWPFTPGFFRMDVFTNYGPCDPIACSFDPNFPDNPAARFYLTHVDSRDAYTDDSHESYYARLWGYFVPNQTTNYTFYLRSDDASQLWLSTNGAPTNKVLLIQELGCCNAFSAHASAPRSLVAGQRYFLELVYHEGTGGDFGQASIDGINPIPGELLGIYADPKWRLDIRRLSGGVMLSWPPGGTLQETTSLPAQWTDRTNAPNPFVISNGPTRFFRLRFPQ